jgi:Tat protein secretion system quality control protein TatD with DNase activity
MGNLNQYIGYAARVFETLPDPRIDTKVPTAISDIWLAALSLYFMQSASWLESQETLLRAAGASNAQSLFNIKTIPTKKEIMEVLDKTKPELLKPIFTSIITDLYKQGAIDAFTILDNKIMISVAGKIFYKSKTESCENCNLLYHLKLNEKEYYHTALGMTLCSPNLKETIALPPTFPQNVDPKVKIPYHVHDKQIYEFNYFKHILESKELDYIKQVPIFLCDAFYTSTKVINLIKSYRNSNYIIHCYNDSYRTWLALIHTFDKSQAVTLTKLDFANKLKYEYSFKNDIELIDDDNPAKINYICLTISPLLNKPPEKIAQPPNYHPLRRKPKPSIKVQKYSFITDLEVNETTIEFLISLGRLRYSVDTGFSSLNNRGYNLDLGLGHGQENLANVLSTIKALSSLIHEAENLTDETFKKLRRQFPTMKKTIEHICHKTSHTTFNSFAQLVKHK